MDTDPTPESITVATAPAPARAPWTERLSDSLQSGVKVLIGANRKPPRRLKSLLHGTGGGHPLHPAITDVPIGAWLVTAIFDIIWLTNMGANPWAAHAALVTIIAGFVASLGAFVTGISDWSDSYGAERSVGLLHGSLNTAAILVYLASIILRFGNHTHDTVPAAVLGFAGVALVLTAAYFGGDMVFAKGTNVNHTAWEAAGEDFEPVMAVDDAQAKTMYRVTAAGVPVLLLKLDGKFYAISATCSHAGGPLDEGELQGDVVQCPWHGSRFRVRDGRPVTGPATVAQPRYDVRVREGQIEVKRRGGH
ncbi:MAG TPA: Rieske 2Fe-2S domain-containing protein [Ktedonobacterales bacterium]|nr:Rieske 2Fe-2S domain-containing protein [Ktedonobacterales bacterium]